jgi:hypothetical protein
VPQKRERGKRAQQADAVKQQKLLLLIFLIDLFQKFV